MRMAGYPSSMRKTTYLLFIILLLANAPAMAQTLRVSIFPFSPPFSYFSVQGQQRELAGYTVDECLSIGKFIGREIEFVEASSIARQADAVRSSDIPVIAHDSREYADQHGFVFLPVGVSLQHHLYRNKSCQTNINLLNPLTWEGKRFVKVKGAPYVEEVPSPPGTIEAPSALEALHILNDGVADIFVAPSERVADHIITTHDLNSIRKEGSFIGEAPLGLVVDPTDTLLISQLSEAIKTLERNGSLARIRGKWFNQDKELAFTKYAKHIAGISLTIGLAFLGFALWNISLKRRVEKVTRDMRRTEQRYRSLIESSPDMIFLITEDGTILHANERAMSNMLLTPSYQGMNIRDLVAEQDREEVPAFIKKVFHDGCDKYEFHMDERTNAVLEVEIAGRLIQGTGHAGQLACLFARNVTDRNRMEEELIQSERLAIIGKMAACVAHEINNPLGIIQYNAEDMLYAEEMSDDAKDSLTAISRNASRAADTITHMMDLASPKPMAKDLLHLEDEVKDSISLLGPKLKKVRLTLEFKRPPLTMQGDSRAIQQVLVNLLLNALGCMNDEGTIDIQGSKTADGIRLAIKDEGTGIAQKDLPRIFDPFFTSRENGFGLGLFITRRIVERHDGIIFAESEPGGGTQMVIEFPTQTEEGSTDG